MSIARRTLKSGVKRISAERDRIESRNLGRAGVVGTMIALKIIDGQTTDQLSLTYLVSRKRPKRSLAKGAVVPTQHVAGGARIATDVVQWPRVTIQTLEDAQLTFDGRSVGTLSCFGLSDSAMFGVTCAHCLTGADGKHSTPTMVSMYSGSAGRYVDAGESKRAFYDDGDALPGKFGFADCGLFTLKHPPLARRAASARSISTVTDPALLLGQTLYAESALVVDGFSEQRRAKVVGIYAKVHGQLFDVALAVEAPGTFAGDSGLMWRTADGAAAAIHMRGETSRHGSRRTVGMLASRVEALLQVNLAVD